MRYSLLRSETGNRQLDLCKYLAGLAQKLGMKQLITNASILGFLDRCPEYGKAISRGTFGPPGEKQAEEYRQVLIDSRVNNVVQCHALRVSCLCRSSRLCSVLYIPQLLPVSTGTEHVCAKHACLEDVANKRKEIEAVLNRCAMTGDHGYFDL